MKIPERWESVLLQKVAEVRSGLSKSSNRQGKAVKKPYLRVANVQDGFVDFSEIKEIDVPISQIDRFTLRPGDLLLIEGNGNPENLGRGCIWQGQIPECIHQNHVFAVRTLNNANLLPEFLMLQLQSRRGRNYLLSCAKTSTGLSTLNSQQLKQFPVQLPPLAEQRKIAEILRTWDEAIEKLQALRAAKERRLTGLTQKLLGIGEAFPDKWKQRPLSMISTRVRRQNDGGDHPVLTISAKSGFRLQSDKFSRDMAGSSVDRYIVLHEGEFAYNKGNSITAPYGCIFSLDRPTALVPFVYFCFALNADMNREFYAHLFAAGALNQQLSRLINSGVRNDGLLNLDPEDFFGCKVPVPPAHEQSAISSALTAAKREISLLDKEIEALARQKRGMMQKLLTGEWRVGGMSNKGAEA